MVVVVAAAASAFVRGDHWSGKGGEWRSGKWKIVVV